jgi:hypothetical protein
VNAFVSDLYRWYEPARYFGSTSMDTMGYLC